MPRGRRHGWPPRRTPGATTVDGLGMLVHQAAAQLELWTGLPAPVDVMWQAASAASDGLGGGQLRARARGRGEPGRGQSRGGPELGPAQLDDGLFAQGPRAARPAGWARCAR